MRILLIDDDPNIVRLARYSLEAAGIGIVAASNGMDGLRLAETEELDAVLLDVMMPQLDGPAVLGILRAEESTRELPVIFLTGKSRPEELEQLRSTGVHGVIRKPFVPSRLAAEVLELLGNQQRQQAAITIPTEMRRAFLVSLEERIDSTERALDVLESETETERIADVASQFHLLAGAAASYGLAGVSEAARRGEKGCDETNAISRAELLLRWRAVVQEMRDHTAFARQNPPRDSVRTIHILYAGDDPATEAMLTVLEADSEFALVRASTVARANEQLDVAIPDVLIAGADLPDGSGFDVLERLRSRPQGQRAAALMILHARPGKAELDRAVSNSVDGVIQDPTNVENALAKVRVIVDQKYGAPPRILCIGLEKHVDSLATVLGSAGYLVRIGEAIAADLDLFEPDLILAGVTDDPEPALALIRHLRLRIDPLATPIVLVDSSQHADLPVLAARAGATDLLRLPVSRQLLLGAVQSRVQAARRYKTIVQRDPLSGCLREAYFLERLQARLGGSITLAIAEAKGEQHALALADLLRRWLRDTDEIGSIGQGRFAIAMEKISENDAVALFHRLREVCGSAFRYVMEPKRDCNSAEEWIQRASRALDPPRTSPSQLQTRGTIVSPTTAG